MRFWQGTSGLHESMAPTAVLSSHTIRYGSNLMVNIVYVSGNDSTQEVRSADALMNSASSGEFVGDVAGSVRLLAQKEVKLPASGIERALLQFFRFESVDERAAFIIDPVVQNSVDALPS